MWARLILDFRPASRPRRFISFWLIARFFSCGVLYQKSVLLHTLGESVHILRGDGHAGLLRIQIGDLLIGPDAVEELHNLPLRGREAEEVSLLPLQHADDRFAVESILAHDKVRIEAGRTAARQARLRYLRKSGVEGFAEIHGASRTCICIPGLSSGEGFTTAPITCTLPLAGSTTGLTRRMWPGWCRPG